MTEFKVGDKVTVNDSYFDVATDDDNGEMASLQTPATVVSTLGMISVKFDSGIEWDKGQDVWLFAPSELDKL
jgi:hypothetical protein